jgi:hypothetical protein
VYAGGRGNGSYVDCHDNSAFYGYSISTDSCGFFGGYDPANYNLGQYLQGTDYFHTQFCVVICNSASHYIQFHNYGDGYVGYHRN